VALAVGHGGLQVSGVELVRLGETEGTELAALLDDGVHEAKGEHKGSPLVIGLDLLKEVLVDHGVEGSRETGLQTIWWLGSYLDSHLKETERERGVRLASDPETEIRVDLLVLGVQDLLELAHVLKGKMAVVEDEPVTGDEAGVDLVLGFLLLTLTHGNLLRWGLLLLACQLFNTSSGISSRRK
jgi:hypothetical protein